MALDDARSELEARVYSRAGADEPRVERFDPETGVTLVVSEDGFVTCDGARKTLPPDLLLRARQLTRDLSPQAELNLTLPERPGSVLHYRARMAAGSVSFADTSRPLPESFAELTVYTKDVAERVCGLARP